VLRPQLHVGKQVSCGEAMLEFHAVKAVAEATVRPNADGTSWGSVLSIRPSWIRSPVGYHQLPGGSSTCLLNLNSMRCHWLYAT
jgi:hypothetical protein